MNNFKSNIYFSQWKSLIARLAFKFLKGPKFTDKNANYKSSCQQKAQFTDIWFVIIPQPRQSKE